ncbi:STAS domain-containing protein [Streptomyces tagetis]|uniref:STAS domain-containing protein n=1 Tax=Streptomyces tagetis TaxID=2820809 RepID=A0A940XJZ6_9ACTN|nr:STAS domain-containing protein [Streptomyces sp. RG38]MBQ0827856.1 STAS domain-containing protein [Streptomyces sp. RG38]
MTPLSRPYGPSEPPGCAVLALPREIDFCNAAGLLPLVLAAAETGSGPLRLLVLDLTGTRFMDSQGVRLLDDVRRRLRGRALLRVVAVPGSVPNRVLELSGLRRDVPVHGDLAEALAAGTGASPAGRPDRDRPDESP